MQVVSRPDQFGVVLGRTRQRNHSRISAGDRKRKSESQAGPTDSMNGGATSKTGIAWSVSTGPPGVPTRAIHPPTDKSAIPPAWRSGSSTSYLRFPKHSPAPRVKDESGMAPAVDKTPGHTTVSTSTSNRRPLWSVGFSCCRMCVRVSRLESVYVMVSETSS
jgi:hypothetical protein